MKRCLLVAPYELDSSYARRFERYVSELRLLGYEIWLASFFNESLHPIILRKTWHVNPSQFLTMMYNWVLVSIVLLRKRFDVISFLMYNPAFLFLPSLIARMMGARIIYDMPDPAPEAWAESRGLKLDNSIVNLMKVAEKIGCSLAHRVIVVSEAMKHLILRAAPASKIVVLRNRTHLLLSDVRSMLASTDLTSVGAAKPEGTLRIVYAGRLEGPYDGLESLILSMKFLSDLNVELLLVGKDSGRYSEKVKPWSTDGRIKFFGERPHRETLVILSSADLVVVPSPQSDFSKIALPGKVLEAMFLGIPVVAPDYAGFHEVLGTEGIYFVASDNVDEQAFRIAQVIRDCYVNKGRLNAIGARLQKRYENFSWNIEREKFIRLFRS